MAIWLIRAGSHGEYEQKFIQEKRVYVTWDELDVNLAKLQHRTELTAAMTERYLDSKPKRIQNWVSQIWPFAHEMKKGDLAHQELTLGGDKRRIGIGRRIECDKGVGGVGEQGAKPRHIGLGSREVALAAGPVGIAHCRDEHPDAGLA